MLDFNMSHMLVRQVKIQHKQLAQGWYCRVLLICQHSTVLIYLLKVLFFFTCWTLTASGL